MSTEDRLRRALEEHTSHVEPRPGGLARIEEKLMAEEIPADTREGGFDRRRLALGVGAAAAVVLLVVGFVVLGGDDDDPVDVAGDTTTTTAAPDDTTTTEAPDETTTTEAEATTDDTAPPPPTPVEPAQVLFPDPYSAQRFEDPGAVAAAFAEQVVGMVSPVVGEFRQADGRSGELEIQPMTDGPVTLVLVRMMEDDHWYVTAALTDEIVLDRPATGDEVTSPIQLEGQARAFEGTVQVRVLADGHGDIGAGFVTGGGDEVRPFEGEVEAEVPSGAEYGLVVLFSEGGEDFTPWAFTATRVRF